MAFAIKTSERVRAWELGAGSFMEQEMILRGKIVKYPGGVYELFTREAPEGRGEMAKAGDFFKVDEEGFPCPNEREFFLLNHQPLEGDWYTQVNKPLKIWRLGDPGCDELRFLLDSGRLIVRPEDRAHCFSAPLWGTRETADADAVIVFYNVEHDPDGGISAVDFNFVDADYFRMHYRVLPS